MRTISYNIKHFWTTETGDRYIVIETQVYHYPEGDKEYKLDLKDFPTPEEAQKFIDIIKP